MVRNIFIDGTDCRAAFGVWVLKGGYGDLFSFPAMKDPDTNDWAEYNGEECDLSAPKLDVYNINIDFVASGTEQDTGGFIAMLAAPGRRKMDFPSLGRSFDLRLSDNVDYKTYSSLNVFRLNFVLDEPSKDSLFAWTSPGVSLPESAYTLDGVNFAHYGIFVESGRDSLLRPAALKQQMTRNISTLNGHIYDADFVRFRAKDVTLKCCLKASEMLRLWSCRDAFFAALVQPEWRTLTYKGKTFQCRYVSSQNFRLVVFRAGLCMIEFEVTFRVN